MERSSLGIDRDAGKTFPRGLFFLGTAWSVLVL